MFRSDRLSWMGMGILFIFSIVSLKIDGHPQSNQMLRQGIMSITTPLHAFAQRQAQATQYLWNKYGQVDTVFVENKRLKHQVTILQNKLHQRQSLEKENHELRHLLYLKKKKRQLKTVPVSLLTRLHTHNPSLIRMIAPSPKEYSYHPSELKVGQSIISQNVLIGQVTSIDFPYLDVRPLFHSQTSIDVILKQTRLRGIASGQDPKYRLENGKSHFPLNLRYLERSRLALNGEFALSTGIDGVYPKGLIVGQVVHAYIPENGLFQIAQLQPILLTENIQYALVVLSTVDRDKIKESR